MVLYGPHSANWDIDIGPILLTDWYHDNPFELYHSELSQVQVPDSTLINGKGIFHCDKTKDPRCIGNGSYWSTTFMPGKSHLLRLVNTATDTVFRVSLDGHTFKVISADFVAIRPFETTFLDVSVGRLLFHV